MGKDNAIRCLASRQFGAFSRRQALALGFTSTEITKRLSSGSWIVMHRGVYAVAGAPATWGRRAMCAVLRCGEGAVLSRLAAASVLALIDTKPDIIDVTVPIDRRPIHGRGVRVHRATLLEQVDRRVIGGLPVTSPNRTIVDLAEVLPKRKLEGVLDEAIRRGMIKVSVLIAFLERCGRKRGVATLRNPRRSARRVTRTASSSASSERLVRRPSPSPSRAARRCIAALQDRRRLSWTSEC